LGEVAALIFSSSLMSASSICRRPAVSMMTVGIPRRFASAMPRVAMPTGSFDVST
jgi:hypothetical protein